jgi:hypothetical protein
MSEVNILELCLLAFGAVFVLLVLLSAAIGALTHFFPEVESEAGPESVSDPAMVAAINSSVGVVYPGARVTRIEEI